MKLKRLYAFLMALCLMTSTVIPAYAADLSAGQTIVCKTKEHVHTEACYDLEIACGFVESEGHTHGDECYEETSELTCGLEEGEIPHTHTDACYESVSKLTCEAEEIAADPGHFHNESCYDENGELVCGQEERAAVEGHAHSDSCYTAEKMLICKKSTEPHEHTDECFTVTKTLICGIPESHGHKHTEKCYGTVGAPICGLTEHIHTMADGCIAYLNDGVENQEIWDHLFDDVELTGNWSEDVLIIAETQLGYRHSLTNFIYNGEGVRCGYTRFGHWYALNQCQQDYLCYRYEYWCADFVSFCLHYAGVQEEFVPFEKGCRPWVNKLVELELYERVRDVPEEDRYMPNPGDLIFFDYSGRGGVDHVGLVKEIDLENGKIITIEGNTNASVRERTYPITSWFILGYGNLGEAFERYQVKMKAEELQAHLFDSVKILCSGVTGSDVSDDSPLGTSHVINESINETNFDTFRESHLAS